MDFVVYPFWGRFGTSGASKPILFDALRVTELFVFYYGEKMAFFNPCVPKNAYRVHLKTPAGSE